MASTAHAPANNPLRGLFLPVTDYKWYVLVFCASTIFTSLALTYIYAEKYVAATTLLFRPQNVTELRQKETLAFGAPLPTAPFDLIYDNLQITAQSEPVLLPVIRELGLNVKETAEFYGPWQLQLFQRLKEGVKQFRDDAWSILKHGRIVKDDPDNAALAGVRQRLKLINHNSYVFYLSYVDKDPERAARVVDAIAARVVQQLIKSEQDPGNQRYAQLKEMRDANERRIEQLQSEIQSLLQSNNIASVKLETAHTTQQLFELTILRTKVEGKLSYARERLRALAEHGVSRSAPSMRLTPEDYKQLRTQRLATEIELEALSGEYKTVNDAVAKLEQRRSRLPDISRRYQELRQKLAATQRDLVQISDPQLEAKVQASDAMSQVLVAHKARVPTVPVMPIKVYHVSLATLLALSISFGVAYIVAFARSDEVSAMVSRTVTNIVAMWDGVDRRQRIERRRAAAEFEGPDRRRRTDRRNDSDG